MCCAERLKKACQCFYMRICVSSVQLCVDTEIDKRRKKYSSSLHNCHNPKKTITHNTAESKSYSKFLICDLTKEKKQNIVIQFVLLKKNWQTKINNQIAKVHVSYSEKFNKENCIKNLSHHKFASNGILNELNWRVT